MNNIIPKVKPQNYSVRQQGVDLWHGEQPLQRLQLMKNMWKVECEGNAFHLLLTL